MFTSIYMLTFRTILSAVLHLTLFIKVLRVSSGNKYRFKFQWKDTTSFYLTDVLCYKDQAAMPRKRKKTIKGVGLRVSFIHFLMSYCTECKPNLTSRVSGKHDPSVCPERGNDLIKSRYCLCKMLRKCYA